MDAKCPHCGTKFDAEDSEYGRFVKCAVCGMGFIAGVLSSKHRGEVKKTVNNTNGVKCERARIIDWQKQRERRRTTTAATYEGRQERLRMADEKSGKMGMVGRMSHWWRVFKRAIEIFRDEEKRQREWRKMEGLVHNKKMARFRQLLASAPWAIQFSTIYLYVFGLMLVLLALLTSKPPGSFVSAVFLFAISVSVEFSLARFNFVRWLLVIWGGFNLVILICGSKDFAWAWPFHVSFIAVAVLLMMRQSHQWYAKGAVLDFFADMKLCKRISVLAAVLAVVAGIVLYVGYDSARERMEKLRDDDYSDDDDSLPSYGGSRSAGYESPKSADEAIAGALANVRSRYRASLQRYGLTESYYDETGGICDLMLLDVNSWTKYQIVFYRSSGQLEWPRTMPKDVAELLMHDRMLIDTYEKTSGR